MRTTCYSKEAIEIIKNNAIKHAKSRAYSIGASELAYVLGVSKYKTPMEVYFEKITFQDESDYIQIIEEKSINDNTIMGIIIEQGIIDIFSFQKNYTVLKRNEMYKSFKYKNIHATIDAICTDSNGEKNILVEVKNTNRFDIDSPDIEHYIQVLAQMRILEENNIKIDEAYIVYMLSFNKLKSFNVKYSREISELLISKAQSFYENYIEKREIPTEMATSKDICSYFGVSDEEIMDLEKEEDLNIINEYYKLSDELKQKEKELEEVKEKIYQMGFDKEKGVIKKEFYLGIEKILSISTVRSKYIDEKKLTENLLQVMNPDKVTDIIEKSKTEKIYNRINKSKDYENKIRKK